jgi:membrane associated rhomboid family serine protease
VFLVGASGAVFGVLLAFATLYPEAMIYIFGIIPVRAPILVLGYTVISLFFGVSGGGGNVAHFTHLAGFAFAYLYFLVRLGINPIAVFIDHYR